MLPTGSCDDESTMAPSPKCGNSARTAFITCATSARSSSSTGVSIAIHTISAPRAASAGSATKRYLPEALPAAISSSKPGS
jgi:hypothetical protein